MRFFTGLTGFTDTSTKMVYSVMPLFYYQSDIKNNHILN